MAVVLPRGSCFNFAAPVIRSPQGHLKSFDEHAALGRRASQRSGASKGVKIMPDYDIFKWLFWVAAFAFGISALVRMEAFSTHSTQRTHRHAGQQFLLVVLAVAFALAGFVTAAMEMRVTGH
ncbi:hypothetical protein JOF48_001825 [Arthrobacter stackebrandtii]|uniref:DUF1146 domain-containing protein n=1 Tax=Arthrobacter stackebrandtii TaxID=272161 RepID=A0ABS4YW69_9MICC|nr:hypothetical protein [Arthrobacter stackebrandtii]MBP2413026.1 hypothetical protein [Arthrobacter stackebrandtii]